MKKFHAFLQLPGRGHCFQGNYKSLVVDQAAAAHFLNHAPEHIDVS
uniref:Uncharacterized protein n=1 Tax=Rhizophora mucronata TaxID=61149 RepID=A0A2P2J230_RHIMU